MSGGRGLQQVAVALRRDSAIDTNRDRQPSASPGISKQGGVGVKTVERLPRLEYIHRDQICPLYHSALSFCATLIEVARCGKGKDSGDIACKLSLLLARTKIGRPLTM